MKRLAKQLREMNDLITTPVEVQPKNRAGDTDAHELIKLLPEAYAPFNIEEKRDNYRLIDARGGVCPYCRKKITVYVPAYSWLIPNSSTLDQRIEYANFNILWYSNAICPNCNYTNSYQEFVGARNSREEPCYTGNQFENAEGFDGFSMPRKHTLDEVILSYYLRIACIEQTSNEALSLAKTWIRLYWLYGDYDRPILMAQAAEWTEYYYLKYLKNDSNNITNDNKIRINALLGEVAIKMGNIDKAREYFEEAVYIGRTLPGVLVNQCLARYSEIKDI